MDFLETWTELSKLHEWRYMNTPSKSTGSQATGSQPAGSNSKKTYEVTYYEDSVQKKFTVQAYSSAEAEQIAWSRVDADSLYVKEVD